MKVLFFSVKDFEISYLKKASDNQLEVAYTSEALSIHTTSQAQGYKAISIFTGDDVSEPVIQQLKKNGVQYIAVRAAGYDNVDIEAANAVGIKVANVPEYSPYSIAEHAVAMMLALNRKLIKTNGQVHQQDFRVDNLVGFDLNKKKVGIIGTGRIGKVLAKILNGFGCSILAYDINPDAEFEKKYNACYVGLHTLCNICDIISIHLPLTKETHHLIDRKLLNHMKKGVMLINTSRGGVLKTADAIEYIQNGQIGYLGLDVYEKEKGIFFYNHNGKVINDPMLIQLLGFQNVLLTPHQAFATVEALQNIAGTTFYNLQCWKNNTITENELTSHQPELVLELNK